MAGGPHFKLLLVGDGCVGKTTFCKRHLTGEFETRYNATIGAEIHFLLFQTNLGPVQFEVWDTAGQDKFSAVREGYFAGGECCIVMFDLTNRSTYNHSALWHQEVTRYCGNIPSVLCGNKVDLPAREVKPKHIDYHKKKKMSYYDISAKSNFNMEKPFLALARVLANDNNLQFIATPALAPPEAFVDFNLIRQYEFELATYAKMAVETEIRDGDDEVF
ncbi:uncharacterized protein LOC135120493 [Zophobas morio]|uniref:uncharacterized protein LOC135120493 n=1 Tax=Zophobas morio TaxID=2755281 RepID=UPI0030826EA2